MSQASELDAQELEAVACKLSCAPAALADDAAYRRSLVNDALEARVVEPPQETASAGRRTDRPRVGSRWGKGVSMAVDVDATAGSVHRRRIRPAQWFSGRALLPTRVLLLRVHVR